MCTHALEFSWSYFPNIAYLIHKKSYIFQKYFL